MEANMGLLDILNGMQNGPGGQRRPAPPSDGKGGGMSPLMMALLGLLAYKAIKGGGLENMFGGGKGHAQPPSGTNPTSADAGGGGLGDILGGMLGGGAGAPGRSPSGGLGDILGGMLGGGGRPGAPGAGGLGDVLGGLLAGGAAGSVLNGGLRNLVEDLEQSGQGAAARSWVGSGENQPIEPNDLAKAAGADTIDALSRQTGMPRDELLAQLSEELPNLINQLTPDGRLPTDDEASRGV
jgi:uncharacterized protein YidB (DUF937 family)